MLEQNSNISNPICRRAAIYLVENEWEYFKEKISSLIDLIIPHLKADSGKTLKDSFETLEDVADRLIPDENYKKIENAAVFRGSLLGIEDALRQLFDAYIEEKNLRQRILANPKENRDSIDSVIFFVYNSLEDERNLHAIVDPSGYKERLRFGYPAVTRIVKFVRNIEVVHSLSKPTYRSRVQYFNNIYTLCSIFILTLYGYTEILEVWYDTISITKS